MRLIWLAAAIALGSIQSLASDVVTPSRAVRIGTVLDGPSRLLDNERAVIEREVIDLLEPEFTPLFPEKDQLTADWSPASIHQAVTSLMTASDVDFVITVGLFSSSLGALLEDRSKPLFATAILQDTIPGIESGDEISGIPNYSYIASNSDLERDLRFYRELTEFENLGLVIDEQLYRYLPDAARRLQEVEEKMGIRPTLITVGGSADEALAAIPGGIDALYIAPLYRMSPEEFSRFTQGLKARGLSSFSWAGEEEVAEGAMVGLSPKSGYTRVGRRIALNIQRVLLGDSPEDIPTKLTDQQRFFYNQETAAAIGFAPHWSYLPDAVIFGNPPQYQELTLRGSMNRALCINPSIRAARANVRAGCGEIALARSRLRPQIHVSATAREIDRVRAQDALGREPQHLVRGEIGFTQALFNEPLAAKYGIQKRLQCKRLADKRTVSLDVLLEAGTAYVDLLQLKTLLRIERDNLELTRKNLTFAEIRRAVGVARPNEVYRWESQLQSNKEAVVDATAAVRIAESELNRVLHRPPLCPFDTLEENIDDLMQQIGYRDLERYISSATKFRAFSEFQIREGWCRAPELRSIYAEIQAQCRQVLSDKRRFYTPEVDFFADALQRLIRGGVGVNPPMLPEFEEAFGRKGPLTDWAVGVTFTFPLYEGGGRCARLLRDRERARELYHLWNTALDEVAQRIRESLDLLLASHLNIDFTLAATEAAQKNLDFVADSYAKGVASILDLLDAQNTFLVAEQNAATAQYDFVLDLLRLMRSVGCFDFFLSDCEKSKWMQHLEEYFSRCG